ncbi:hypothetical protein GOBAR_AA34244 [Gossypium barbadense]|uniref:Uncharacterized protein n=1 Tax=Gossypium barbadense TaxID=3634 RepID=A0A2P5W5S3_GOSBA|nr:hypothetical protein GOBAR_AA34244 [Gossypium barbadense]
MNMLLHWEYLIAGRPRDHKGWDGNGGIPAQHTPVNRSREIGRSSLIPRVPPRKVFHPYGKASIPIGGNFHPLMIHSALPYTIAGKNSLPSHAPVSTYWAEEVSDFQHPPTITTMNVIFTIWLCEELPLDHHDPYVPASKGDPKGRIILKRDKAARRTTRGSSTKSQDYAVRHRFPLFWPVADTSGMLLLQRYQLDDSSGALSAAVVAKETLKDRVTQLHGKVDHLGGQVRAVFMGPQRSRWRCPKRDGLGKIEELSVEIGLRFVNRMSHLGSKPRLALVTCYLSPLYSQVKGESHADIELELAAAIEREESSVISGLSSAFPLGNSPSVTSPGGWESKSSRSTLTREIAQLFHSLPSRANLRAGLRATTENP